jgi:hypothetical protein
MYSDCHFFVILGSHAQGTVQHGKKTNALVIAAVEGLAIGHMRTHRKEAKHNRRPPKCHGISGCAANASCAVKADNLGAVRKLLEARFG